MVMKKVRVRTMYFALGFALGVVACLAIPAVG